MYTPKKLERWKRPQSYCGAEWPEYYSAGIGQHRDSDALGRSNFRSMLRALGGESDTVRVIRERHWAVGWVEWIGIHESDAAALEKADEVMTAYEDYPVIDEDDFSNEECEEAEQVWRDCYDNAGRIEYMRTHRSQFEASSFSDLLACARGRCFLGHASELLA